MRKIKEELKFGAKVPITAQNIQILSLKSMIIKGEINENYSIDIFGKVPFKNSLPLGD